MIFFVVYYLIVWHGTHTFQICKSKLTTKSSLETTLDFAVRSDLKLEHLFSWLWCWDEGWEMGQQSDYCSWQLSRQLWQLKYEGYALVLGWGMCDGSAVRLLLMTQAPDIQTWVNILSNRSQFYFFQIILCPNFSWILHKMILMLFHLLRHMEGL